MLFPKDSVLRFTMVARAKWPVQQGQVTVSAPLALFEMAAVLENENSILMQKQERVK